MTDLVQSLLSPAAYPDERPERVDFAETHISWLFFAGAHVYKVKKPVDYGFLDFTTQDRRRFYCEQEVRLNRRLSPDVYLGVVEIGLVNDQYVVGRGPAVEWAVKMRRLPSDRWLSQVLDRREGSPDLMRRIARRIADFHAHAETSEQIRQAGGIQTVRFNTRENFQQAADQVGITLSREIFDRVEAYSDQFLAVRADRFEERERDGRIRDCHGDLHGDQISVENGISFIDCIEFNDRFRFGDTAADIAFTAMDVEYHGWPDLGLTLVREYAAASGDDGVFGMLDFYRCYRAFTRGKVRGFRLRQTSDPTERRMVIDQASRYFELAGRYARFPGPALIVMSGLMGTGKTSLAAALAPRLGGGVISSDPVRKAIAGLAPAEPRREDWGQGIYGDEATERTYLALHRQAADRLRAGEVVILDGSYRARAYRAAARETARAAGAPFALVEVRCDVAVVRDRLTRRASGPSDGRIELLDRQIAEYQPPTELAPDERLAVESAPPLDEVTRSALAALYGWRLSESRPPSE